MRQGILCSVIALTMAAAASKAWAQGSFIPLGTATTVGQSTKAIRKGKDHLSELLNSPLNRVYQSSATNGAIGAKALAQYMKDLPGSVKSSLYLQVDDGAFLQEQAETFAASVRKEASDPAAQVKLVLWRVFQRPPSEREIRRGLGLMADLRAKDDKTADEALTAFCLVALNLNEFIYLD